ncbi:class III lanthionine synthetase LanKC [Actinomadura rupiterrae]|uniref:class III lanthionine synthetase LanKC n=1 Tax=Actinomadura rupiterrae TaxID=559627 RepID=UPI0020A44DA4|nr:class III lanthionine synthetase LanKC [Actinomadura rupiterrae]MCP2337641.1 putative Ser/Thr protein kinase [Actinomadura rupiterrae]
MDQYEPYCLADLFFYDKLGRRQNEVSDFPIVARPVPEGWVRHDSDVWMYYAPNGEGTLPPQGWKIHVSARLDDAERALDAVWDYCVPRGIVFKYLRGRSVLLMRNSKAASRGASGKLVTIYPRDENECEVILKELDELLDGVEGPYILSDLRYADGPLFVRYGGFAERRCPGKDGELVAAIENADGELIPDVRGATFAVPEWVTLPSFLEPHLEARNSVRVDEMPYDFESVLHFSNGGGVYLARDRSSGERVVLKEARPHAGLDVIGRDAVTRLKHERDILQRLAGLDAVPALLGYFVLGEHHFLVEEFVDGNPLQRQIVQRYPLTKAGAGEDAIAEYAAWALGMHAEVEALVGQLHERGVVFGDLHPNNILVTASGRLCLIDYEVAVLASEQARTTLANPAFLAPRDRRGLDVDRYALACLRYYLFAPQTTITLLMHRPKARQLADVIAETFGVPRAGFDDAIATLMGPDATSEPSPLDTLPLPGQAPWPDVRDALHRAILASATPDRDDRLYPGDPAQFRDGGGVNIAHGAAGVLYALAETGADVPPEHVDWLAVHALNPEVGTPLGFYDGLHGAAFVLDRLGRRRAALDLADICLRENWEKLSLNLCSGLAGTGLNLFHLGESTGESALTDAASRMVELCADRLGGPDDVPEISGGVHPRAGLMHGSSGVALLFLHAYERGGSSDLLDRAADALRQDLRRCLLAEDGSLQVNQDWRTLPYLDEGSVGIALVLARYLRHRRDEEFEVALSRLARVGESGYFVQSGLFTGRAGLIVALAADLRPPTHSAQSNGQAPSNGHAQAGGHAYFLPNGDALANGDAQSGGRAQPGRTWRDPRLDALIRGLRWHAMPYEDGLAFTGDQLMRLSMDFATGTAGVLFALASALDDRRPALPFLTTDGTPRSTGVPSRPLAGSSGLIVGPSGRVETLAKAPSSRVTPERPETVHPRKGKEV